MAGPKKKVKGKNPLPLRKSKRAITVLSCQTTCEYILSAFKNM